MVTKFLILAEGLNGDSVPLMLAEGLKLMVTNFFMLAEGLK